MNVVIIGSGSVATHLANALYLNGITISQIYSRTNNNAKDLALKFEADFTNSISKIKTNADVYIYALNDNSLERFLSKFELPSAIHIHTAGSIPMSIFEEFTEKFGVFYPLQTFSKNKEVDFKTIPVCIEASSASVENELILLAKLISNKVYLVNSNQRKKLHLAAVFACNFTNYMYDIAHEIVVDAGFNMEIIQPLIQETSNKISFITPYEAQTGPAKRADHETINRHIYLLNKKTSFKKIYKLLSANIYNRHKKNKSKNYFIELILNKMRTTFKSTNE